MGANQTLFESLAKYANRKDKLPPVEQWDPEYCGEIDIRIKADGVWLHNDSPITRHKMVALFSTILLKQNEQYYLITPAEKVAIQVDWQPFVIVDFEIQLNSDLNCYIFSDNCGNQIPLTSKAQIEFSRYKEQPLPIINIRRNLFASFSRNCYYRLIEQAEVVSRDQQEILRINSAGIEFELGRVDL